ncbi:MAG: GIY-YIG nuclease family protein [Deltaproteobacteria bacterium]|nr:GIY-YIG nuclease family protein [Deltaproteobacteria bacterium]RLB31628.1 MAG: GIY-YIG nuclease family protein [Deltaproteobacteria bacterium]
MRLALITVYVLRGTAGKRYIGITNNLYRRLREHRLKKSKAGHLLGDFSLVHTEKFADYKIAREREKFLKSGRGRRWLDELESGSGSTSG